MKNIDVPFFDFNGFAAKTDLENNELKTLLNKLEIEQANFLGFEESFRSGSYKWPRDPLHTWSRLWEYPYVYHHIQCVREQSANSHIHVLDFGSGVTFFPFAIAKLGCSVICADIDPVCAVDIPKAAGKILHAPGNVDVKLIENEKIPVETESQDVVYCISVIEHIPNFELVVDEMARVLKHGGKLILTVDIDLRGSFELSIDQYDCLLKKLDQYFIKELPERPIHPRNLLTTFNSPYCIKNRSILSSIKQILKNFLSGYILNGDPRVGILLGIYSGVYVKK